MASSTESSPRPPPSPPPRPPSGLPRGLTALGNPRFRWFALWLALLPIALSHVWTTLVAPALTGSRFSDFVVYLAGARTLAAGGDPYAAFFASVVPDYNFNQTYIYPPLIAWLLQPVTLLGDATASWLMQGLLQTSLVVFGVVLYRALGRWTLQELLLAALLVMAYLPVRRDLFNDQLNLLLLMASAFLLLAWVRGDRWWGGAGLGAGVAAKLLQAPLGLLLVWGRRWRMLAAAIGAGGVLTLVAAPQFLPEYLLRVLPRISHATGFRENSSPAALIERIAYPGSFFGGSPGGSVVGILGIVVAVAVLIATWWALGRKPRAGVEGRALEVAAGVAAVPLLLSVNYHQSLEMLPILVLVSIGVRRSDWVLVAAAAAGWLLPGPVHSAFLAAIGAGFSNEPILRTWNELQLLGIVVLWLGCLRALVRPRGGQPEGPVDHFEEAALEQQG